MEVQKGRHPLCSVLADTVGSEYVSDADVDLWAYSKTVSGVFEPRKPDIVVRPRTTEEISRIVQIANETKTPVVPRGGGLHWGGWATPRKGGILLDMTRMNNILKVDDDAMVATVEAGITFAKFDTELRKRGFRHLIFPESGGGATIGGNINMNGACPYRTAKHGRQESQVVALKVVLPTGSIIQTGTGAIEGLDSFVKTAGYGPDLTQIFMGALGTLGVVTEASIRIYELPEAISMRIMGYDNIENLMKTMRKIQRAMSRGELSTLSTAFLVRQPKAHNYYPWLREVPNETAWTLWEGPRDEIELQVEKLAKMVAEDGGRLLEGDYGDQIWGGRFWHAAHVFLNHGQRATFSAWSTIEKVIGIMKILDEVCNKYRVSPFTAGYHGYNGFITVYFLPYNDISPGERQRMRNILEEMQSHAVAMGAVTGLLILFERLSPNFRKFIETIKRTLDPNNILNPGVLFY